tara:strand:+ start:426 stop:674 length:249 start_codon:yes stop_codon:yes gene_type:complete
MKWISHNILMVEKLSLNELNQNEFISIVEGVSLFNYKLNVTNRLFYRNKISDKEKKILLHLLDNSTTIDEIKQIIKINKLII